MLAKKQNIFILSLVFLGGKVMPRGWNILATKLRTLGIVPHLRIFKAPLEDALYQGEGSKGSRMGETFVDVVRKGHLKVREVVWI